MSWQQFPDLKWIYAAPAPRGAHHLYCEVCGAQEGPIDDDGLARFAEAHAEHQSPSPTHLGMGDAFAAVSKSLGIQRCTPCEQRRMAMNNAAPNFWRR